MSTREGLSITLRAQPAVAPQLHVEPQPWMADAACARPGVDPEWFFPHSVVGDPTPALRLCFDCPVAEECLAHALELNAQHGIWGGLTAEQRVKLRRARRGAVA